MRYSKTLLALGLITLALSPSVHAQVYHGPLDEVGSKSILDVATEKPLPAVSSEKSIRLSQFVSPPVAFYGEGSPSISGYRDVPTRPVRPLTFPVRQQYDETAHIRMKRCHGLQTFNPAGCDYSPNHDKDISGCFDEWDGFCPSRDLDWECDCRPFPRPEKYPGILGKPANCSGNGGCSSCGSCAGNTKGIFSNGFRGGRCGNNCGGCGSTSCRSGCNQGLLSKRSSGPLFKPKATSCSCGNSTIARPLSGSNFQKPQCAQCVQPTCQCNQAIGQDVFETQFPATFGGHIEQMKRHTESAPPMPAFEQASHLKSASWSEFDQPTVDPIARNQTDAKAPNRIANESNLEANRKTR